FQTCASLEATVPFHQLAQQLITNELERGSNHAAMVDNRQWLDFYRHQRNFRMLLGDKDIFSLTVHTETVLPSPFPPKIAMSWR
uniref:RING-type E3 ubiquitin transferase n=1 Tax=Mesocestoides corti TaxID=53468 RepID=A0A5K3FNK6_MESCO